VLDGVIRDSDASGLLVRSIPKFEQIKLHGIDALLKFVIEEDKVLVNNMAKIEVRVERFSRTRYI
jgi:hypothetical protein